VGAGCDGTLGALLRNARLFTVGGGGGDSALGALLWATSLYFINPIQVRRQAAG
jgi:hypothetical protein